MSINQNYQVLRAFGHEAHVIVGSGQTGGEFCLMRIFASTGNDVPLHTHRLEDEIFMVESGELEVNRGGQIIQAVKGDVVYLPKNIPHAPRVVSQNVQVLVICVPGGFDRYFAACAEEWSKSEPNLQYLNEIAARFGQEFHPEASNPISAVTTKLAGDETHESQQIQ